MMPILIIITFLLSLIFCLIIIRSQYLNYFFSDSAPGPQKNHTHSPSRLGGVALFLSLASTYLLSLFIPNQDGQYSFIFYFLLLSIPCFMAALHDDLFKDTKVSVRLFCTAMSAFIMCNYFDILIIDTGFNIINGLIENKYFAIIFTIFAITGLANAYNIIDGFNGLSSMVGILSLSSLAYGYFICNDITFVKICLVSIASIFGFFVINYPKGKLFLGDCGAYLIGLLVAILSVNLAHTHPIISPFFIILINIYPVTETLFSIIRRLIFTKANPTIADSNHLHTLIFKHIIKMKNPNSSADLISMNAKTSPFLWCLSIVGMIPAILLINNPIQMKVAALLFILIYLSTYYWILGKDLPNWLK